MCGCVRKFVLQVRATELQFGFIHFVKSKLVFLFRYAVLGEDGCSCSNLIPDEELDRSSCNRPCQSNSALSCGGFETQSYYNVDLRVAGPPRNISFTSITESSIVVKWEHPETNFDSKAITQYIIRAKIFETYANYMLLPPPEWRVEKNDAPQTELVNLHPGTTYNITITSNSQEYGEGGTAFVLGRTYIAQPDPEPREPHVISRDKTKLVIEFPPAINNNGPISSILVVVVYIDSELSQTFDPSLLTDYKHSQEDGTSYYITAELPHDVSDNPSRGVGLHNRLSVISESNATIYRRRRIDIRRIFQRSAVGKSTRSCVDWRCE